jgi:hypothetical protein
VQNYKSTWLSYNFSLSPACLRRVSKYMTTGLCLKTMRIELITYIICQIRKVKSQKPCKRNVFRTHLITDNKYPISLLNRISISNYCLFLFSKCILLCLKVCCVSFVPRQTILLLDGKQIYSLASSVKVSIHGAEHYYSCLFCFVTFIFIGM